MGHQAKRVNDMKRMIGIILAVMALMLVNPASGLTQSRHGGGGAPPSGGGGHPSGGGGHPSGGGGHPSGGYSHGGSYHGGYSHGGYHNGSHGYYSGSVFIGTGWGPWWGPGYPYYYPYYPYYYPYYTAPPVVIQQTPTQYIQRDQESEGSDYWYFCRKPEGYYPYVKRCPNGWLRVVPSNEPPDVEK